MCLYVCVFVWWTSRLLIAKGRINVPPVGLFACLDDVQLISKICCGWEMRGLAQAPLCVYACVSVCVCDGPVAL